MHLEWLQVQLYECWFLLKTKLVCWCFISNVKDIHSVLEVTVYDEDRDKKAEFLGKIAIPILRVSLWS